MSTFEQGPIRPPSEAGSLLLRLTRNCPWNQCSFCPVYKGASFSRRSIEEIRGDIDAIRAVVDEIQALSDSMGCNGELTNAVFTAIFTDPARGAAIRTVAAWLASGQGTVFLQDANSLILPTETLVEALEYLKARVPGIRRITSYARSSTLARKGLAELKRIREAGLDRIHIGLESGSDRVLTFVKKGTTAQQHIEAGKKVVAAGMSLSEYIMPGLGGRQWSEEHALETARVLNAIDPHFIRVRSLRVPERTPLYAEMAHGRFLPLSDDDTVREIRLLIASLDGIHSRITSDHIMNLLQEVEGTLPQDRPKMLAVIDRYLAMPEAERLLYRLGRRGGAIGSLEDLNDAQLRSRLERARQALAAQTGGDIEKVITELGDQYI